MIIFKKKADILYKILIKSCESYINLINTISTLCIKTKAIALSIRKTSNRQHKQNLIKCQKKVNVILGKSCNISQKQNNGQWLA